MNTSPKLAMTHRLGSREATSGNLTKSSCVWPGTLGLLFEHLCQCRLQRMNSTMEASCEVFTLGYQGQ